MNDIATCLWFDDQALEAARLYVSLIENSEITRITNRPEGGVLLVEFTLGGVPYQALNGGDYFKLSEAVSISVATPDQAETDRLWAALTADGGEGSQCGWLRDRFGLSWQIVPRRAAELLAGPNAARAYEALMGMGKIELAALEEAAR
ncbi:MAG: VOC family protein [Paracoccus sp. (in: a-proteobacteria)]|nr:VOC family protein [Paracoccus sp. (in: a-proteobacteria)]